MARSVREIDRNEDKFVGITFPLDHSPEGFFYKTKIKSITKGANNGLYKQTKSRYSTTRRTD